MDIQRKKTDCIMDKILAQDEVDALLRGLSGGELETETDIPEDDSGIVPRIASFAAACRCLKSSTIVLPGCVPTP